MLLKKFSKETYNAKGGLCDAPPNAKLPRIRETIEE